jgi:ABC-2 type transport system ATP-binding protein
MLARGAGGETPAVSDPVIETVDLSKTYRDFWGRARHCALDRLSLTVERGEVFGFLGPNGSGKTTTMKLLLGLLFPSSGHARVLGREPADVEVKRRIGFLPEESYLYRYLNAEETLDFFGRVFGLSREERRRRADALIAQFDLQGARRRPLREYSKGMVRRVGFAQALLNDPEILFLDEPTSGLDPIASRRIKDLILELKARGKTVFMSSHLLADVQDICDRIAILHEGRLRRVGPVRDLLAIENTLQFTVEGLAADRQGPVLDAIRQAGGRVASVGPARDTLEALFLRTVERRDATPERRETPGT